MHPSIFFHAETSFKLAKSKNIAKWIEHSILSEKKELGEINFIFCDDDYLLKMNQTYLQHNTFTDVITFDYVEGKVIAGDIFISIERVKENAEKENTTFNMELSRVMIHGILHLIGYKDKTAAEAKQIRAKEDFYLTLLSKF